MPQRTKRDCQMYENIFAQHAAIDAWTCHSSLLPTMCCLCVVVLKHNKIVGYRPLQVTPRTNTPDHVRVTDSSNKLRSLDGFWPASACVLESLHGSKVKFIVHHDVIFLPQSLQTSITSGVSRPLSHPQDLEDAGAHHDEQEEKQEARTHRIAGLLCLYLTARHLQAHHSALVVIRY